MRCGELAGGGVCTGDSVRAITRHVHPDAVHLGFYHEGAESALKHQGSLGPAGLGWDAESLAAVPTAWFPLPQLPSVAIQLWGWKTGWPGARIIISCSCWAGLLVTWQSTQWLEGWARAPATWV